ncbi:MAG: glycosyltransferase [Verrucomicrobia bacterium]|nr:glycosyltransferase [Verrucomicrobiota bacterium]
MVVGFDSPMRPNEIMISYVVCTHNGERTLARCLAAIIGQAGTGRAAYEVVIATNGCTDGSVMIAGRFAAAHPGLVRHIDIRQPGKSLALRSAFNAASGRYLAVIDDDNYLSPEWERAVLARVTDPAFRGVLGTAADLTAEAVRAVSPGIAPFIHMLAVGEQQANPASVTQLAWGAGSVFSREIWDLLRKAEFDFILQGRVGPTLVAGEDGELCLTAYLLGYAVEYDNSIRLQHDIKPSRLTADYLIKMARADGVVSFVMYLYQRAYPRRRLRWRHVAWDLASFAVAAVLRLGLHSAGFLLAPGRLENRIRLSKTCGRLTALRCFGTKLPVFARQVNRLRALTTGQAARQSRSAANQGGPAAPQKC